MKRTTISLPDELADALERESRRRDEPVSAVVREALAGYLGFAPAGERREIPFAAVGRSGRRTTARDMEALLEREWRGDARGR